MTGRALLWRVDRRRGTALGLQAARPRLARISRPRRAAEVTSQPLKNRCNALAAAYAHRHQRITALDALQLVQRLDRDQRARRANRMPQRDARAVPELATGMWQYKSLHLALFP